MQDFIGAGLTDSLPIIIVAFIVGTMFGVLLERMPFEVMSNFGNVTVGLDSGA